MAGLQRGATGDHPPVRRSGAIASGDVPLSLVALVVGVVVGLASGGRLAHAATWRVGWWWLLAPGVGLQLAADRWHLGWFGAELLFVGYCCLLAFAARNAGLVGIGVASVGLLTNLAVITADGGMPVHPAAVVGAGIATSRQLPGVAYGQRHHLERSGDHLTFLDDRIPLSPLNQVVSVGDLILFIGVVDLAANLVRRPGRRRTARLTGQDHGAAGSAPNPAPETPATPAPPPTQVGWGTPAAAPPVGFALAAAMAAGPHDPAEAAPPSVPSRPPPPEALAAGTGWWGQADWLDDSTWADEDAAGQEWTDDDDPAADAGTIAAGPRRRGERRRWMTTAGDVLRRAGHALQLAVQPVDDRGDDGFFEAPTLGDESSDVEGDRDVEAVLPRLSGGDGDGAQPDEHSDDRIRLGR